MTSKERIEKYIDYRDTHSLMGVEEDMTIKMEGNDIIITKGKEAIDLIVPDFVNVIGDGAFYSHSMLKNVELSDSVTKIDKNAFDMCDGLTSVRLGGSVVVIEEHAFGGCVDLLDIRIPNSVQRVGDEAFRWCVKLERLELNNLELRIGSKAFGNCQGLKEVTIHNVKTIAAQAFYGCHKMEVLRLPLKLHSKIAGLSIPITCEVIYT